MRSTQGGSLSTVALVALAVWALAGVAATVFAFMLAHKLYNVGIAILVVILTCIPCLNLIALLVVSNKATRLLKDKGYNVGFLGADLSQF
jgi:hypothetical protein